MKDCLSFKTFRGIYTCFCIVAVVVLIIWCIYVFCLNEDVARITIKNFNSDANSVYPSISFVFLSPFAEDRFRKYDSELNSTAYKLFLQGQLWTPELSNVDYNEVSIDMKNYFSGYDIEYEDNTQITYNASIPEESGWKPPYSNGNSSIVKGFSVDIPHQQNLNPIKINIKIRTTIFQNQTRPSKVTGGNNINGFGVFFHYPKQASSAKQFFKSDWPIRKKNDSKSYVMKFELKDVEVIRSRDKWKERCLPEVPNIDLLRSKSYFEGLKCKPPYWNSISNHNLTACSNKEDMKKLHDDFLKHRFSNNKKMHAPCNSLEKLHFDYFEFDLPEESDPHFIISIVFVDIKFREIVSIRSFDIQSLFGNIGGYVGIFIGYALLQVPEALVQFVKRIRKKHNIPNNLNKKGYCIDAATVDERISMLEEQMKEIRQSAFNGRTIETEVSKIPCWTQTNETIYELANPSRT